MNSQQSVIGKPGASGTLDEVSSTRDPIDAVREPSAADRTVLLVGGVPGAGKSTAIGLATAGRTDVDVVDSDTVRRWLRSRLPERLPYRRFRWLVHTLTALRTIGVLVRGPRPNRRLLVHDPSTRSRRRELFARLARFRAGSRCCCWSRRPGPMPSRVNGIGGESCGLRRSTGTGCAGSTCAASWWTHPATWTAAGGAASIWSTGRRRRRPWPRCWSHLRRRPGRPGRSRRGPAASPISWIRSSVRQWLRPGPNPDCDL